MAARYIFALLKKNDNTQYITYSGCWYLFCVLHVYTYTCVYVYKYIYIYGIT